MLTVEEKTAIHEAKARCPHGQSAGPEALLEVQKLKGWISDECLKDIAAELNMSEAQLDAVATFYNRIYRKPVGKHVVKVCDGVSCWMSGGDDIGQCILSLLGLERMGQTTPDGLFTVLPASCLGACDKAPVMMVDNELYVELSPESIVGIIERYTTGAAKPGE